MYSVTVCPPSTFGDDTVLIPTENQRFEGSDLDVMRGYDIVTGADGGAPAAAAAAGGVLVTINI